MIQRREPPPAGLDLPPQGEEFTVVLSGQGQGGQLVQHRVELLQQGRDPLAHLSVEHAFILSGDPDMIKEFPPIS